MSFFFSIITTPTLICPSPLQCEDNVSKKREAELCNDQLIFTRIYIHETGQYLLFFLSPSHSLSFSFFFLIHTQSHSFLYRAIYILWFFQHKRCIQNTHLSVFCRTQHSNIYIYKEEITEHWLIERVGWEKSTPIIWR